MNRLLIFDFDGVIADSEVLSNTVLAECISEIGVPTTVDDSYRLYMGKRLPEIASAVAVAACRPLSENFAVDFEARVLTRFRGELRLVRGVRDYIAAFSEMPRCIASASSPERLGLCVELLGLGDVFGPNVFSAAKVPRGKPYPDVFLYAAAAMGADPAGCVVLEDGVAGVRAGVAAGMTVIGILAGSHVNDGHGTRLRQAGAHFVAADFEEACVITRALLAR